MEIQFQQPNQNFVIQTKTNTNKGNNKLKTRRNNNSNRFVGVRQRPSGRWVAEIKDTTQKIRMWLGTFETAEQAARAYDEAAWLLRGSNTRTNFITTHVSSDSPLASRIHNLLNNNNKSTKKHQHHQGRGGSNNKTATTIKVNSTRFMVSDSNYSSSSSLSRDQDQDPCTNEEQLFENSYKPDLSVLDDLQPNFSWGFGEVMDLSKHNEGAAAVPEFSSEFERMKVERQISASLYAMNGVQEYMETIHDPAEAFWDLPPLCSLLC